MLHDRLFPVRFVVLALVLVTLGVLAYRLTWYPVPMDAVAGMYIRPESRLLDGSGMPDHIIFNPDGSVQLLAGKDSVLYEGAWQWEGNERRVRIDDPLWDHRFRVRSTLFGPRLCMRLEPGVLLQDDEEKDVELDLAKQATAVRPTSDTRRGK